VGIGTISPIAQLHLKDGDGLFIQASNARIKLSDVTNGVSFKMDDLGNLLFANNGDVPLITYKQSGNTLFGKTNDAGDGLVQVNGNITASPAVSPNQVVVKSQLDAFVPSGTVNLTGNQNVEGQKTFTSNSTTTSQLYLNNQSSSVAPSIYISSGSSNSSAIRGIKNSAQPIIRLEGNAVNLNTPLLHILPKKNDLGISITNGSALTTDFITQLSIESSTDGAGIVLNAQSTSTYTPIISKNNGTTTFSVNKLGDITANSLKLNAMNTAPASATATGTVGEIRVTATHIYVCTATNTWVRSALTTW
jgi:hypothetical protein